MEGVKQGKTALTRRGGTSAAAIPATHDAGCINAARRGVESYGPGLRFRRAIIPFGGIKDGWGGSCKGVQSRKLDPMIKESLHPNTRKTHSGACSTVYTGRPALPVKSGVLAGADAYGRGRIIGDYRRCSWREIDYR